MRGCPLKSLETLQGQLSKLAIEQNELMFARPAVSSAAITDEERVRSGTKWVERSRTFAVSGSLIGEKETAPPFGRFSDPRDCQRSD